MNKMSLIDKAMTELNMEQLSILTKTMRLLLENPKNKIYRTKVESNLKILNRYLPILIKNKKYIKEQLRAFGNVYEMLKSIYREGFKHRYYGMLRTLMKSRSLLEDMQEMMSIEEIEIMADITRKTDTEIDIDKMYVVRPEGNEYYVDLLEESGYKPVRGFYKLKDAQDYADYQIGFTERMHEFRGLSSSLFRDESKERDINIWRQKGRDDAESTILSSAIGRDRIRKDTMIDTNEKFFNNLIEMNKQRKILNQRQILSIINAKRKSKGKEEINELSEELLSKTQKGTSLGSLLERIANSIILEGRKRL